MKELLKKLWQQWKELPAICHIVPFILLPFYIAPFLAGWSAVGICVTLGCLNMLYLIIIGVATDKIR